MSILVCEFNYWTLLDVALKLMKQYLCVSNQLLLAFNARLLHAACMDRNKVFVGKRE